MSVWTVRNNIQDSAELGVPVVVGACVRNYEDIVPHRAPLYAV